MKRLTLKRKGKKWLFWTSRVKARGCFILCYKLENWVERALFYSNFLHPLKVTPILCTSSRRWKRRRGNRSRKERREEVVWRFNEILITLLVSGHSPLSFVLVHEKLNCRTWYPWKASPSKSVVIYERVQLINISGPAFNGLRRATYDRDRPKRAATLTPFRRILRLLNPFPFRISSSFFLSREFDSRFL